MDRGAAGVKDHCMSDRLAGRSRREGEHSIVFVYRLSTYNTCVLFGLVCACFSCFFIFRYWQQCMTVMRRCRIVRSSKRGEWLLRHISNPRYASMYCTTARASSPSVKLFLLQRSLSLRPLLQYYVLAFLFLFPLPFIRFNSFSRSRPSI